MRTKEVLRDGEEETSFRLNKYLSEAGVCSRRKGDALIQEGRVTVNGQVATMGQRVTKEDVICLDGKKVELEEELLFYAYNKPEGVECTTAPEVEHNIIKAVGLKKRVFPVGRLDKDSTGLILLTNEGSIVNAIMKASMFHEKEYVVRVNHTITDDFIEKMRAGVRIVQYDKEKKPYYVTTRPCRVWRTEGKLFHIVLTQGYNRQIRRMCKELGYKVLGLQRIRIMNLFLGTLDPGQYRIVTDEEIRELKKLLK